MDMVGIDSYAQVVRQIIKEQESIIGPVALEQARKISGLEIANLDDIKLNGDAKKIVGDLVAQYAKLFGKASIEVCKEAIHDGKTNVSSEELPEILR